MTEVWKDVPGYEGTYQVSNFGRVKRSFANGKENILQGKTDKDGYVLVVLSRFQKKKFARLHRLVAEAFIPNPDNKPQVNHKDRNKQNNMVSNIEWATASENTIHCCATGRGVRKVGVLQYTRDMVLVSAWDSIRTASKNLGINEHNISSCCRKRLGTAGGFVWRYKEVNV